MTTTKNKSELKPFIYIISIILFLLFFLPACEADEIIKKDFLIERSVNLMSAVSAYYDGDFEESIVLFERIIFEEPDNMEAAMSLARLYEEAGRHIDAAELLKRKEVLTSESDLKSETSTKNRIPLFSMWEDSALPLFLSGNSEKYIEKTESEIKKTLTSLNDNITENSLYQDELSEILFFTAWAFEETGNIENAVKMFASALKIKDYFPLAHLALGKLYFNNNDFAMAETHLGTALKQDSNLTQARPYLAKTILAQKRLNEGYLELKKTITIRPWDKETALILNNFENTNPEIIKKSAELTETKRITSSVPKADLITDGRDKMPQIRVGLAENIGEIFIKTGGNFLISSHSGELLLKGGNDQIYRFFFNQNNIDIFTLNGDRILSLSKPFSLVYEDPFSTTLIFDIIHSSGYHSSGQEDRAYRGKISVIPFIYKGMTIVNTLPLEEYLYSVVPSEIPSHWPDEALAAQAVAARSYTLANMGKFEKRGFDLSGSIHSAFYRGLSGENIKTTAAVEKTRGIFLKHNGSYLNAFYSANSAGRTESAKSVWNMNAPITGVTDPQLLFKNDPPSPSELTRWILSEPPSYSSVPPYYFRSSYRWRIIVPTEEIEARIGKDIGGILSITTRGRGMSGRVNEVLVKGLKGSKIIRNDSIRNSLGGLRSNLFIVMPKMGEKGLPEYFIFAGAGWGHGVGMCQTGAAGMASGGFTADEILQHYYPLAELIKEY
jgi:SpoIID/LytB domain protein